MWKRGGFYVPGGLLQFGVGGGDAGFLGVQLRPAGDGHRAAGKAEQQGCAQAPSNQGWAGNITNRVIA